MEGRGHNMSKMATFRVRPHRTRAAAAGSDLCPQREVELYYVRLHHPHQTGGGLTWRTSRDRGGQQTFVFWRQI